jgi:three-Cys-motif partner protein
MCRGRYAGPKVVFIDGFSGTGRFEDGSDGSPVVALKTLLNHTYLYNMANTNIELIFIEKKRSSAVALRNNLNTVWNESSRPSNGKISKMD